MDFDKYKNTMPYPSKQEMIKQSKKEIEENFVGTKKQIDEALQQALLEANEEYKRLRNEYYAESARLEEQFTKDLFEDFGLEDNKKTRKAYSIAYEHGHSGGYNEIYNYFIDLAPLVDGSLD